MGCIARLGLAGLGRMGHFHARNLVGHCPSAELVRVVDLDEARAKQMGAELGVEWSPSVDDILNDPSIDAVVIVVPTPFHADLIERASAAGKHIFCEKPISLDWEPSVRAVQAARSAGVKLQLGFHRRFDPDWNAAVDRIRAGELGDVYMFRTSLRDMRTPSIDYIKSSGGFFIDVTIHDFDNARWMVGEIDEVWAQGAALSDPRIEGIDDIDTALVVLRFDNGALGVADNMRAAGYGYECSTEVIGSRATVRIDNHRRAHIRWLSPGTESTDWVKDFTERYPEAYRAELEDFARAVVDDRAVRVTGEDALAAFVLCKAAEISLHERRPVRLEHYVEDGRVKYEIAK
ncbi:MAG: inositol 2-dehydrogenase [Actinobacteria bacterium]|nr:inositol 2-dehydrogenase [Actinomycetota bacterium]